MTTYNCPKGHTSTESDYCSECGTKIQGEIAQVVIENSLNNPIKTAASLTCPACTAPYEAESGNFCEICGYNFTTGVHGEVPPVISTPESQLEKLENQSQEVEKLAFKIVITIDPALRSPESPEPSQLQPIIIKLDKDSNLIGRTSQMRGIYPEISLDFDTAVSHRHALINIQPDGSLILRDIGSSNGTTLNGIEIKPMVDTPLHDGDEFTLGHWTRLQVKKV